MSSGAENRTARKQGYFARLIKLLDENPKIFIVGADNVGSSQLQKVRLALRGKGIVLMGKNTMIRKAIRGHSENNKALEALLPHVKGNVGFVFVKEDLAYVRKIINDNKIAAPAKAGTIAPCDVIVPAGNTGMEPTQTSFLQALNIPSKITRGQVEIINDVHLIKEGAKVGTSEATLLAKWISNHLNMDCQSELFMIVELFTMFLFWISMMLLSFKNSKVVFEMLLH